MPPPKTSTQSVLAFISSSLDLLTREIGRQQTLVNAVKAALPDPLASQILHCVARPGKIIIYTGSSAWASQLRFYQDVMLDAIDQQQSVLQVKVLTQADYGNRLTKNLKPLIPSAKTIHDIENASQYINDTQLASALARLSATLSRTRRKR